MNDVNSTFGIKKLPSDSENSDNRENEGATASEKTLSTISTLIIIAGTVVASMLLIASVNSVNHSESGGYELLGYAILAFGIAFIAYTILKVQLSILITLRKIKQTLKQHHSL